ncbi:hypothetical protein FACS1894176_01070 [Bacteroidia bacterium]|nr:hypothetical protein FACS189428_3930 [Clostridia bacterium]GHV24522.1 hypothetical protein FACS1894176_01070 [Bacteroidia bacterium]
MKETELTRKEQIHPLFAKYLEASFDEYESAIRAFLEKENPESDEAELSLLVEEDILEMMERLKDPAITPKVWKTVIATTKEGRKLTNVAPEEGTPEVLEFTNLDGQTKEVVFNDPQRDLLKTLNS